MTRLRQDLVREEKLSSVGRQIRLGEAMLMDKSFALTGGRENPSVLCDAFEAVLAAVYLDGGVEAARAMVARLIGDCAETGRKDDKSALQEYLQARGRALPAYETVGEAGPPHERIFTCAVLIDGAEIARGTGASKKQAEQEAARTALRLIKRSGE